MEDHDNIPITPSKLPQPTKVKATFAPIMRSAQPPDQLTCASDRTGNLGAPSDSKRKKEAKQSKGSASLYKQQPLSSKSSYETQWVKKSIGDLESRCSNSKTSNITTLLQDQLRSEITLLQQENIQLKQELDRCREENDTLRHQALNAVKNDKDELQLMTQANESLKNENNTLREQVNCLTHALEGEKLRLQTTIGELDLRLKSAESKVASYSSDLATASFNLSAVNARLATAEKEKVQLLSEIDSLELAVQKLEGKLRGAETLRRRLFNELQELKGNIRVFCRLKPFSSSSCIALSNEEPNSLVISEKYQSLKSTERSTKFSFDRIFGERASQQAVWEEVSQLVQSSLDGFKVCIFAYGQTGSGKTFTIEGNLLNIEMHGIIPRSVCAIFEAIDSLKSLGWTYSIEMSFLEIYNETIRDLLANGKGDDKKLEVKQDGSRTYVANLTVVNVNNQEHLFQCLQEASKNRSVGATRCNERSSRSHSVFTLTLKGNNSKTGESCEGTLNLVDLAGSERLKESGATGERLEETKAINKSLSSLADVIVAIGNGQEHIPYRNSKLTYLLQGSMGSRNGCKMLMFVNVSQETDCANETLCSLRFATKVNSCHIGTAKRMIR